MRVADNFSPGNAGVIFDGDILIQVAATAMLVLAQREKDDRARSAGVLFVDENGEGALARLRKLTTPGRNA